MSVRGGVRPTCRLVKLLVAVVFVIAVAVALHPHPSTSTSYVSSSFRLGYADRTLGLRLPGKRRRDGAEIRGRLEALGIFRASGHEHFAGSLVIPVLGGDGTVCEVYGRKVRDDLRAGTPAHLYLPGPHRGVWNIQALAASDEIIVCESLIDALTFWCAGFRHVTASYGAGAAPTVCEPMALRRSRVGPGPGVPFWLCGLAPPGPVR